MRGTRILSLALAVSGVKSLTVPLGMTGLGGPDMSIVTRGDDDQRGATNERASDGALKRDEDEPGCFWKRGEDEPGRLWQRDEDEAGNYLKRGKDEPGKQWKRQCGAPPGQD